MKTEMKTEQSRRISLFLIDDQINHIVTNIANNVSANINPAEVIMDLLYLCEMPQRYVKPKNERGQGRKKGITNKQPESKQDVFRVNRNDLAPYGGGNKDVE